MIEAVPVTEKVLTLRRMPDGSLIPYIDGSPILGSIDTTVNTNGTQKLVQLVFHSSLVQFETAPNGFAEKMN
jgi:hypothetical protein